MRGEHFTPSTQTQRDMGSSPHARGAQFKREVDTGTDGIIPACAGSTYRTRPAHYSRRDHPRMRGEHHAVFLVGCTAQGSSPHARGAQVPSTYAGISLGIIPACAGSTSVTRKPERQSGDHPRMRGEHFGAFVERHCRMWIIPACAGSTTSASYAAPRTRDHPRMRGEHRSMSSLSSSCPGSSPHARGARYTHGTAHHVAGIIPACAGSTSGMLNYPSL